MAASQFKVYDWGDPGAPTLDGTSGSLIRVLEGCLVNGYGTKTPVGWTQPIPTISASWGYMACFKQPSGSGCTLMINDGAPTGSLSGSGVPVGSQIYGTMEAWATGWETLLGFTGSATGNTGSGQIGTGSGQFPLPSMTGLGDGLDTSGSVEWLKAANLGSRQQRPWRIYADAYTMYFFVGHGTVDEFAYSLYGFGDIYSFKPTSDRYKCMIMGRIRRIVATTPQFDTSDFFVSITATGIAPVFFQRSFTGIPGAIAGNKIGSSNFCNMALGSTNYSPMVGIVRSTGQNENICPITPILTTDGTTAIRGKFRGLWFPSHHSTTLLDGQIISGSNHNNGRIFQVIRRGPANGIWAMEISNTIETNDN
jgi:hypothetical protein